MATKQITRGVSVKDLGREAGHNRLRAAQGDPRPGPGCRSRHSLPLAHRVGGDVAIFVRGGNMLRVFSAPGCPRGRRTLMCGRTPKSTCCH